MNERPRRLGLIRCADGRLRPVFELPDGQQFVLREDGEQVFGIWKLEEEADEPQIGDAHGSISSNISLVTSFSFGTGLKAK